MSEANLKRLSMGGYACPTRISALCPKQFAEDLSLLSYILQHCCTQAHCMWEAS